MNRIYELVSVGLFLSFAACCLASALLQMVAWSRHRLEDVPVSFRGLRNPDGYFDAVGIRQMLLARRLLLMGAIMYLSYGIFVALVQTFAKPGS